MGLFSFCSLLFSSHSVLFYSLLSSSVLSYSLLFSPILSYSLLFSPILSYSLLLYSILFYSVLYVTLHPSTTDACAHSHSSSIFKAHQSHHQRLTQRNECSRRRK